MEGLNGGGNSGWVAVGCAGWWWFVVYIPRVSKVEDGKRLQVSGLYLV